jgi:hypothetical protein
MSPEKLPKSRWQKGNITSHARHKNKREDAIKEMNTSVKWDHLRGVNTPVGPTQWKRKYIFISF